MRALLGGEYRDFLIGSAVIAAAIAAVVLVAEFSHGAGSNGCYGVGRVMLTEGGASGSSHVVRSLVSACR